MTKVSAWDRRPQANSTGKNRMKTAGQRERERERGGGGARGGGEGREGRETDYMTNGIRIKVCNSLTHSLTHPPTHSLTHTHTHTHTHPPTHTLTHSHTHPHPPTHSLKSPSRTNSSTLRLLMLKPYTQRGEKDSISSRARWIHRAMAPTLMK